ncbi:fibropellin-1 isoform X2 [Nematostella vectensis]|uniref:fibropellin-1 isoform X2 n=1 Tax=Nematostella vectensis TaxID=45351 RepID=UPI00207795B1|nr:fibropellin-1 isoform X2 [Nematostella vectensis]
MRLTCLVLYFNCLVAVATSSEQSFCPASIHSVGAPITQVGLVLRSRHVKKRLQGQSQISCSLRCQQQDWCISVNFEVSRPEAGACELNTYGVETLDEANPNNSEFEKKKGWIYSQLRSAEFTQSLHACKDGSFTCSNGGTCEVDCKTFRPRCHCPAGFSGDKCENNDDECKSSQCKNGGTCVDGINRYSCTCVAGFTGKNCETDIDECAGNPCANGGTCKDGINGFTCECPVGYSGSTCEIDIDECSGNPCANGGTCKDGINGFTCECPVGYSGSTCEIDINECAGNPCANGGTCKDGINGFTCECPVGYSGSTCEIDIDECAGNPCANGGTCKDGINGFTCECAVGYNGRTCEIDIDECASGPCQNGATCNDGVNNYTCSCIPGFNGTNCETNIDECASGPCQNGATCNDGVNNYTCLCIPGFNGTNCETNIDECIGNPCANGGTCKDGINGFTCECPVGYSGSTCEGCDLAAVGVQNRSLIPDESFSAPNYWQDNVFPSDFFSPKNARLNGDKYWIPQTVSGTLYLQVDLLSLYMICAVATQGGTISQRDTRATRYKLSLSTTESSWQIYQESGADKEFQGNLDKPTVVKNALVNRPTARYIRFIPTAWDYWPGFRVEVFGIRQ